MTTITEEENLITSKSGIVYRLSVNPIQLRYSFVDIIIMIIMHETYIHIYIHIYNSNRPTTRRNSIPSTTASSSSSSEINTPPMFNSPITSHNNNNDNNNEKEVESVS
jgi:hypothetical protein